MTGLESVSGPSPRSWRLERTKVAGLKAAVTEARLVRAELRRGHEAGAGCYLPLRMIT